MLTFDVITNALNGIRLGTNPVWPYILLGYRGTKGISAMKCNIMVDDDLCIWLYDYYLTHGTVVGYSGRN
jgi:hypothetical protein